MQNPRSLLLSNRFREVMLNGRWVANTNFLEQLSQVSLPLAAQTIFQRNSIALLAQHIHYYMQGLIAVFKGGSLDIRDQYSFDFPPLKHEAAWTAFRERFQEDASEFAALVKQMPDEQLDSVFCDEKYGTYGRNIDCLIEHAYYHLGQVVLLRKILESAQMQG